MNALQQAERELTRGATVNEVALRFGLRRDQVQGVADAMKVRKNGAGVAATPQPRPALTGPAPKPPAKPSPPGDVVDASLARIVTSLDELREAPAAAEVEQLLAQARDRVERARAQLSRGRERERLKGEIAQLKAQLADRQAQLAGRTAPAREVEPAVIRAWAAANGVECPTHGRVPARVVDAWREAGGAS